MADWFKKVFGCTENDRAAGIKLEKMGDLPLLRCGTRTYLPGTFYCPTLKEIRKDAMETAKDFFVKNKTVWREKFPNQVNIKNLENLNVMDALGNSYYQECIFQVASQTNCLEHPHSGVNPELGITDYYKDKTQGPACSIACPAGTYVRNWHGLPKDKPQTRNTQISLLGKLAKKIKNKDSLGTYKFFSEQNGYVLVTRTQKKNLKKLFNSLQEQEKFNSDIVDNIQIGVMEDTEVLCSGTLDKIKIYKYEPNPDKKFTVTQVFCSAISLESTYNKRDKHSIDILAKAILDAQYESLLWLAVKNACDTGKNSVFLTLVGGGVFENPIEWIQSSITRAINIIKKFGFPLTIYIIHYGKVPHHGFYAIEGLSCDYDSGDGLVDFSPVKQTKLQGDISSEKVLHKIDDCRMKLAKLSKKVIKNAGKGKTKYSKKKMEPLLTCQKGMKKLVKK